MYEAFLFQFDSFLWNEQQTTHKLHKYEIEIINNKITRSKNRTGKGTHTIYSIYSNNKISGTVAMVLWQWERINIK